MIRSLRRRFIFSAMLSFAILLLILIVGVTSVGFLRLQGQADAFMQSVLQEQLPQGEDYKRRENRGRHIRPMENHIAYYDVRVDADGEVAEIREKGIWEPDMDAVKNYAVRVIASGKTEGKIDNYKFLLQQNEDNSIRLILMDNSTQVRMLKDVLRITLCLSLGCLVLLFLILLPISDRVVRSYAQHIEKQKQFITNAGHEIKTPVAIIMSNVDAMELIQGENKWSRNIRSQTDRLNILLQRLLFMARIDETSFVLPAESLKINALLQVELESYGPAMLERGLQLDCDLQADAAMKGSREYLQQLVHILMDNAVQYADEGGKISVILKKKRRRVRMLFSNTVEKLPDCAPEGLFDRFYRGDSARTQSSGGYGIGLSAARAIVEMHRGSITAEYEGEHKIRFVIEFPA